MAKLHYFQRYVNWAFATNEWQVFNCGSKKTLAVDMEGG
jgi:hypothetical protein